MLGNDIIDLQNVLSTGQARRRGFQERVGHPSEFGQLPSHLSLEVKTWVLWAIKESAYKCYIQAGESPIFAPKKFIFVLNEWQGEVLRGLTQTPTELLKSRVQVTKNYVIAESWPSTEPYKNICHRIMELELEGQDKQSQELKDGLCQHFSAQLEIAADQLLVRKNEHQIPFLFFGKKRLPYSLSLSHHGTFGLFSYRERK